MTHGEFVRRRDARVVVVQLIDGFATEEASGGAAQFALRLALELDPARFRSIVCGLWKYDTGSERRWRQRLADAGIGSTILTQRRTQLPIDLIRALGLLNQFTTIHRPDVLNSHFERGDLLLLLLKLLHPAHPPIVRTMHTDQQWQQRPWLGALLNLVALPWCFDAEVAISQATAAAMDRRPAARLRGRNAVLLYNGLSRAFAAERLSEHVRPRSGDGAIVACVGRLEPQKGHIYLLRAAVEILRVFPKTRFWMIGSGSLSGDLEATVRELGIDHAVHWFGQRNDVAELLRQVDVLVSASIWEGFPTVLLEAMALGVPVVATDVSGSRELVVDGRTGRLVAPGDVQALAHAITGTLAHPQAAEAMANAARQHIRPWSMEATAARYGELYSRLTARDARHQNIR